MVGFTASGGLLFNIPNDTPQIATADNGVIGASGTTYDQNGNVDGQLGTLPTYSFTAAYQLGSVDEIIPPSNLANIATSWAAVQFGNLGRNGSAFVHQTFALNWCSNQACQLTYNPQYGGAGKTDSNVDFDYQMARVGNSPNPTVQLSDLQIGLVENQAIQALQKAFQAFPVRVLSIGANLTTYTHMVEVSGGHFYDSKTGLSCGLTAYPRNASTVWYPCNLTEAQFALNLEDTNLSQNTGSPSFASLLKAIGEGIGNTAAHEIGHQFLDNLCGMNDNPNLLGVYNGGSADAGNDPSMYTGIGPNGQPLACRHRLPIV